MLDAERVTGPSARTVRRRRAEHMVRLERPMSYFDPRENSRRIREGLIALTTTGFLQFSEAQNHVIVIFNVDPGTLETGRIHLFQDFIADHMGVTPVLAKVRAECIKAFFDLGPKFAKRDELKELFRSPAYDALREDLDIPYVQFAGELFPPQRSR